MTTKTITRKPIKCIQWTGENNGEVLEFILKGFDVSGLTITLKKKENIFVTFSKCGLFNLFLNEWLTDDGQVLTTEEKDRLYEEG